MKKAIRDSGKKKVRKKRAKATKKRAKKKS